LREREILRERRVGRRRSAVATPRRGKEDRNGERATWEQIETVHEYLRKPGLDVLG
jgi:hypothetical protein